MGSLSSSMWSSFVGVIIWCHCIRDLGGRTLKGISCPRASILSTFQLSGGEQFSLPCTPGHGAHLIWGSSNGTEWPWRKTETESKQTFTSSNSFKHLTLKWKVRLWKLDPWRHKSAATYSPIITAHVILFLGFYQLELVICSCPLGSCSTAFWRWKRHSFLLHCDHRWSIPAVMLL